MIYWKFLIQKKTKRRQEECTDETNLLYIFSPFKCDLFKISARKLDWLADAIYDSNRKNFQNIVQCIFFPSNLVWKWNYSFFHKSKIVTIEDWYFFLSLKYKKIFDALMALEKQNKNVTNHYKIRLWKYLRKFVPIWIELDIWRKCEINKKNHLVW